MLRIDSLRCSDVRNFVGEKKYIFDGEKQFVVILGPNGTGKTTLLEMLFYVCHLKSFRTAHAADLISFNHQTFFVEIAFHNDDTLENHVISVGCDGERKVVKCDEKAIRAHKEILQHYRVLGVTEDDLDLIRGAPQLRRTFLYQTQMLFDPEFVERMRAYRRCLNQRNALLYGAKGGVMSTPLKQQLMVWTKKLWELSVAEIDLFKKLLVNINAQVAALLANHCASDQLSIHASYESSFIRENESFDNFWTRYEAELSVGELAQGRTLWGLHLDDLVIDLTDRSMRRFASRGQQKLAILLLKVSVLHLLGLGNSIFIVDDFMTDFDANRIQQVMQILKACRSQMFITSPLQMSFFTDFASDIQFLELGIVSGRTIG